MPIDVIVKLPQVLKFCNYVLQVHWFQQQHEKVRKKRDYVDDPSSLRGMGEYPQFALDQFFPRQRQQQQQQIYPTVQQYHRQRNRGIPIQSLFTDPLFKEQWYLVSIIILVESTSI